MLKKILDHTIHYYKSDFYNHPIEVVNIQGEILVIITDSFGEKYIYTWYDIVEKNTESKYIGQCILGGLIYGIPKKVLIIGFGGGAFAKYLEDHVLFTHVTGVDIDPVMIEIAQKEMGVKTRDFYITDAGVALDKIITEERVFDLILLDVYGGDGEIPDYFMDYSFFSKIQKCLSSGGILSSNFIDFNKENSRTYKKHISIHNKILEIFGPHFSHLSSQGDREGNVVGIYNLKAHHTVDEYISRYMNEVKNGTVIFDVKIITKIFKYELPYFLHYNILQGESGITHCISTIQGGVSDGKYGTFNLGAHVGDDEKSVIYNRNILSREIGECPVFMNQIHGNQIRIITKQNYGEQHNCDTLITQEKNIALTVMVADCIPLLLYDPHTSTIAVVHAGWKGIHMNIIQKTLNRMHSSFGTKFEDVIVGMGPCISQKKYEVGEEVYSHFDEKYYTLEGDKALLDILSIATDQLIEMGILLDNLEQNKLCTFDNSDTFFSARRSGVQSGRFGVTAMLS